MSADPPPDDAELFRAAIGPVRKLAPTPEPPSRPKPKARAGMAEQDDIDARSEFARLFHGDTPLEAGDGLSWRREGVPSRVLRRLACGEYAVQDELDLHRATAAQAADLLRAFFRELHGHDGLCIRIIHGKGLNSEGLPVLKNLVDRVLRQRSEVVAFHSAPAAQGGTGAVLVLLRR